MSGVHHAKKTFKCEVNNCEKIFGSKQLLQVHQRSEGHGKEKLVCQYDKCTAAFASLFILSSHTKTVHFKERAFGCLEQGCGKKFTIKQGLEYHLRAAHGAPKLVCKKDKCTATFVYERDFYKHTKNTH